MKALEMKVVVIGDLENQVARLTEQISAANNTNQMLHQTLAKENATLAD